MNTGASILMVLGAAFTCLAALGLVRMPDVYTRMHAGSKAGTLGAGLMLLGMAAELGAADVYVRAGLAVLFLLFTAPVAAHVVGRAAYRGGVGLWESTSLDEMADPPDHETEAP